MWNPNLYQETENCHNQTYLNPNRGTYNHCTHKHDSNSERKELIEDRNRMPSMWTKVKDFTKREWEDF